MTAPIRGMRDTCQKLRELEERIAQQRKLIASEACGCDTVTERAHLAGLLSDLDRMLAQCDLIRQHKDEEASLDHVVQECPL